MGEEIKIDELENREYPPGIKAAQVFVTGGTLLIFFAVLYWSVQAWAAFLALFGSYKVSVFTPDASLQCVLTALLCKLPLTMNQASFLFPLLRVTSAAFAGNSLGPDLCLGVNLHRAGFQAGSPATENGQPEFRFITDHRKWREMRGAHTRLSVLKCQHIRGGVSE